jgi:hypothetical protein
MPESRQRISFGQGMMTRTGDAVMVRSRSAIVAMSLGYALTSACSGPVGPSPIERIVIESGDGQTGTAGEVLASPVTAQVFREDGSPAEFVLWVELVDPGTIDLAGSRASGQGTTVRTPDLGTATVLWTLGDDTGEQVLRFYVVPSMGDTISITTTAIATAPM